MKTVFAALPRCIRLLTGASAAPGSLVFRFGLALFLMWTAGQATAGSIVQVQTSVGNFYLEVDEDAAPITAGNFLNYVSSGRYNNTFIHSVSGGSTVIGGGYRFNECNKGPQSIDLDAAIPLETTGLENLGGSIAAWHPSTEPDGATSQWLISLGNDPALDTLNGGYAVFGKVLGDGLSVVGRIARGNPVRLGFFEETPTVNYLETSVNCQDFSRDNLIQIFMSVVDDNSATATASYVPETGVLRVNLDLGADGFQQLEFTVDATATPVTVRPRLETAALLSTPVPNMATFKNATGLLTIPSIEVAGEILYRNVQLELSDPATNLFTLRSAD